jgi:hypothetical protein
MARWESRMHGYETREGKCRKEGICCETFRHRVKGVQEIDTEGWVG